MTGEMYEYEDVSTYVMDCLITRRVMSEPLGTLSLLNTYTLEDGMFVTITNMFTTAGVSASQIVFEGYVNNLKERYKQVCNLVSPAKADLDNEFPVGDYSGRTDEIIVDFIADYFKYITAGTLSAGTAMGTITFAGDKSAREILNEFALTDGFIFYFTPTGAINYNNGTVDSVENFTATSTIWNVDKLRGNRAVNYVNIKGGFVSGAQVTGTVAEDIPDQQLNGRIPVERTFSHLDLAAQCTTTNTNVLARYDNQALVVPFSHQDSTVGIIQEGETVTFEYNVTDPNISSDQFLIDGVVYNVRHEKGDYTIRDELP